MRWGGRIERRSAEGGWEMGGAAEAAAAEKLRVNEIFLDISPK
jgi:hypothetical protein